LGGTLNPKIRRIYRRETPLELASSTSPARWIDYLVLSGTKRQRLRLPRHCKTHSQKEHKTTNSHNEKSSKKVGAWIVGGIAILAEGAAAL